MIAELTTAGFVAISAGLVAWQVRSHSQRAEATPARKCPRCGAAVAAEQAACPRCRAPLQAYDVVLAKEVAGTKQADGPLHALVRADMCVGCGTCVGACPEPGAIRLVDKLAVVDLDRCKGHGSCATACPVGAIVVTSGDAVQEVEVPKLDVHFESNVPGLYIAGELGGRGLIKNAVNEGKLAIEHIASELPPEAPRTEGDADTYDVVIVGSGPAGLSAALAAHHAGLDYLVLEQGNLSETIYRYPRRKLLFAEPVHIPLYGDLWVADASKETLLRVWQDLIERNGLHIRTGERVETVVRENGVFLVQTATGGVYARRVLLAMGRRGTPRRLGVPGEELDKVYYDVTEMEAFAGQRVVVVGGGDSAIESALGLANQSGTSVILVHRGTDFARAKERNRAKLDAAVAAGRVRLALDAQVSEIRPGAVALVVAGQPRTEPNDVVIVRIGGEPPTPFLERAGVRIVRKEIPLAASRSGS
jgi:thioredoxin reductase (NADPH)